MSDEEIISINRMKLFIRSSDLSIVSAKDMDIVVNLIENQEKRIQELEERNRNSVSNEKLINYMNIALDNSKTYLRLNDNARAKDEYKRYKDLKDMIEYLVYHKTIVKGGIKQC